MQNPDREQEHRYLRSAAEGDKGAFGILYTHYLDEIYRYVFCKTGSRCTAEDITEETFIKTWEILPGIYKKDGQINNLRAWLYRIANNLVIDFYRKSKPTEEINSPEPGNTPFPEAVVVEHEQSEQLANAVRKLKPDFQQIIILRLINELTHKEAAAIMKISEGHSRVMLHRALRKLKAILIKMEA